MEILVLGCSDVFLRRALPSLYSCTSVSRIHIASKSKSKDQIDKKYFNKLGTWFDDYSIALNSLQSDLVYISLPNHLHFTWAKKSLFAGLHVIVEKPATLKLSDTKLLAKIAYERNLCLAESTVWSFHPNIEILKNKLNPYQNSEIEVNATFTVPAFKSNNYRNSPKFGGGAFNDLSAYAVSVGRILFNQKPSSVSAKLISFDKTNRIDTGFSVLMEFNNGKKLNGFFGFELEYKNTLEIAGKGFLFELNRVFSPPAGIEVNMRSNIDGIHHNENLKGDVYANFFNSVITTCQTQERIKWLELIMQDAELTNELKSKIIN